MMGRDKRIQIASFADTTVVGINSGLVDYKLAWNLNKALSLDLTRYDDLVFEGTPYSFFYYTIGENYDVYNLVSLVYKDRILFPFKPRLDYLFLIQGNLSAERQIDIMGRLRGIDGIGHAFILEKGKNLRQVLETIAECELQMINRKKKQNNINEVRKQLKAQQAEMETLRAAQS